MNVLISDINILSLNNFDLLIVGILAASTIFALIRGFTKSLISLTGWIASMGIGMKFYFVLDPLIGKYITLGIMAAVIAGITLFLISAVAIAIINNVLYLAVDSICGGLLDRSIGLLFGFLRGCLLASFLFYIMLMFMPELNMAHRHQSHDIFNFSSVNAPSWAKKSQSILLLSKGADLINDMIPEDFGRKLKAVLSPDKSVKKKIVDTDDSRSFGNNGSNRDSTSMILNFLPKEVLDKIPQDDLVTLQDESAQLEDKARILENISKEYQQHIEEEDTENMSQRELDKRDAKYYRHMSIIENQIIDYNNPNPYK